MPIRGPRKLYKIEAIQVDDLPDGTGGRPAYVKMKEPIGDWLGLQPLPWNSPDLIGTFAIGGNNAGYKFIRRRGGFRHKSYTIVAKTEFQIEELIKTDDGPYNIVTRPFKSMSIGFPVGTSVRKFAYWIGSTNRANEISHIITPSGVGFSFGPVTG